MIVYASTEDADGVCYDARATFRRGVRSSSYYDPDEPPFVEDVEIALEGSGAWQNPEDVEGIDLDDLHERLVEAGLNR